MSKLELRVGPGFDMISPSNPVSEISWNTMMDNLRFFSFTFRAFQAVDTKAFFSFVNEAVYTTT